MWSPKNIIHRKHFVFNSLSSALSVDDRDNQPKQRKHRAEKGLKTSQNSLHINIFRLQNWLSGLNSVKLSDN